MAKIDVIAFTAEESIYTELVESCKHEVIPTIVDGKAIMLAFEASGATSEEWMRRVFWMNASRIMRTARNAVEDTKAAQAKAINNESIRSLSADVVFVK